MTVADFTTTKLDSLISLADRRAVITGGAVGIGRAIARRLAEAGADVCIGDLDDVEAKATAAELEDETGHVVRFSHVDVSERSSVDELARFAEWELGGLDIWVNNAGIYPSTPVMEMTEEAWDRVLDVNLRGTFLGSQAAARVMIENKSGGVIVNLASTAGFRSAGPGVAHYVASKHGVVGLTKSLAVELGVHGIRVLAIAPTLIETPGIDANRQAFEAAGLGDVIAGFAGRLPLGRVGVADDVARVALFCASDLAAFMTGSTLAVDAGELAM